MKNPPLNKTSPQAQVASGYKGYAFFVCGELSTVLVKWSPRARDKGLPPRTGGEFLSKTAEHSVPLFLLYQDSLFTHLQGEDNLPFISRVFRNWQLPDFVC